MSSAEMFSAQYLDELFPASKTDQFFAALYGDAEDGAYDIRLRFTTQTATELIFHFELHQRPGMCLACNLTYGLPQVFARHPLLAVNTLVEALGQRAGVQPDSWRLLPTKEVRRELHIIPLAINVAQA
ncbi:MAG: pancreas/duodenum homeobox protein 1 [Desulfovibrionales bacterium]|nr:pancreas/duodenum homeobox protein 1 [Desulfovibrionales bacterium]